MRFNMSDCFKYDELEDHLPSKFTLWKSKCFNP